LRIFFYISLFFPFIILSQDYEFKATTTNNNLHVGESTQIDVTLNIPASKVVDTIYFELSGKNDSLGNNWELWGKTNLKTKSIQNSNNDYFIQHHQQFTIANFDTGKFEFPPIIAKFNSDTLLSNPILFTIQFKSIDQNASIKNIKPIKDVTIYWWEYVLYFLKKYGLLFFVIILLIIIGYLLLKKLKKTSSNLPTAPTIALEIQLLEKLKKIEEKELWQNGYFKKYYSEISEILWAFLEHCYNIKTFEKTSDEILKSLKWSSIPEKYFFEIKRFFQLSDGVKFAKFHPLEKDNLNAITITKSLIEEERKDLIKETTNIENE